MRKLFPPQSASTPYQLRKALLYSASRGHYSSPCVSSSRLERELFSSSSTAVLDAAHASDAGSGLQNTNRPDGQDHDRNIREQDTSRTIAAPPPKLPYRFETGISLFAKRAPRPFPPPFLSPPSGSFSDPLSTHHQSRDRRPKVNGQLIKGWTNGDDAAFASEYFVGANDGVGAWSARPRGHAGYAPLSSRPAGVSPLTRSSGLTVMVQIVGETDPTFLGDGCERGRVAATGRE
jgi:hypothetical protein